MGYNNLTIRWRQTTHAFDSASLWQKRLGLLSLKSQGEIENFFVDQLKDLRINIDSVMSYIRNYSVLETDGLHSSFDLAVANDLCQYVESEINKHFPLQIAQEALASLRAKIYTALEPITLSLYRFEHKVFNTAFPSEGCELRAFIGTSTYNPEWIKYFLNSYPLFWPKVTAFATNFKRNISHFISNLYSDIDLIRSTFNIKTDLTKIINLDPFCGDFHNEGKSTICITLANRDGVSSTFYYKPRSLKTDILWNELIVFLTGLGLPKSTLPTCNIDRGSYGWQNVVVSLFDKGDVEAFKSLCFKQGINIGLSYVFGVQDLISDNIKIIGDTPVFFDMEMFLSPMSKDGGDYRSNSTIAKRYINGIIKTGLVPCFGFETLNHPGHDNSGISVERLEKSCHNQFVKENLYSRYLIEGFRSFYDFVSYHKNQIIAYLQQLKHNCHGIFSRFLIRYTFNYAQIQGALYSPLCQSDFIENFLTLENLWRGYNKTLLSENIIQEEIRQLSLGDIPLFKAALNSTDLFNVNNEVVVKDFFACDGISASISRLNQFSYDEFNIQKGILNRALYIHNYSIKTETSSQHELMDIESPDLLHQIVKYIYSLTSNVEDETYFCYIDYKISKDDIWDQGIQQLDLFQGLTGIGIFLMAWHKYSKEEKAKRIVCQIFDESIEYLRNNQHALLDSPIAKLGIMHFPTSLLYYNLMGLKILGTNAPLLSEEDANKIFQYIEIKYKNDDYIDYFSGSTGLALVLMDYYKYNPSDYLKHLIINIGNHLLNKASKIAPDMISWEKKDFPFWGGFAHGNSSISYTLFRLWEFSGNRQFYDAGANALRYDQALFNPSESYWNKTIKVKGDVHHSWGNGSAGIALSRVLVSKYFWNSNMSSEILAARNIIQRELDEKRYTDHSIASGLMGLLEIGQILDRDFSLEKYLQSEIATLDLRDIICGGWEGNPIVTGLYYGYAGIGYNLIKLKYNFDLPSLLWI